MHNAFVYEAEELRVKSQAGQIRHNVTHGMPLLRHCFQKRCVAFINRRNDMEMALQTRYTLRCNTTSRMKSLI